MFLNELNKNEALAFVNLVKNFATVDEVFAKEEEELINDYIEELNLKGLEVAKDSLESSVNTLKSSSDRNKNIVFFELVGLALVDGSYDEKEIIFLNNLAKDFGISEIKVNSYINFFHEVQLLYTVTFSNIDEKIEELKNKANTLLA